MSVFTDNSYKNKSEDERYSISLLEVADIITGEHSLIREFDSIAAAPQFSPDGDSLIYNSGGLIYRYEFGSKKSYSIPSHYCDSCVDAHVLSPSGEYIALSHNTYEDGLPRIYIIPATGGTPKLITPFAPSFAHGWSPDGSTLVYSARRNGEHDIYTISANGGRERRLTFGQGFNDAPEFSPCGEFIYYSSSRSGLMQIYRMDRNGGNQIRISHENINCRFPHVSPDNKLIAYLAYKSDSVLAELPERFEAEIRLMPVDGGNPETLASLCGGPGTLTINSWSSDSAKISFVSYRQT